jgi:hypothetical protein
MAFRQFLYLQGGCQVVQGSYKTLSNLALRGHELRGERVSIWNNRNYLPRRRLGSSEPKRLGIVFG